MRHDHTHNRRAEILMAFSDDCLLALATRDEVADRILDAISDEELSDRLLGPAVEEQEML